jgi:hypothetical protein
MNYGYPLSTYIPIKKATLTVAFFMKETYSFIYQLKPNYFLAAGFFGAAFLTGAFFTTAAGLASAFG